MLTGYETSIRQHWCILWTCGPCKLCESCSG